MSQNYFLVELGTEELPPTQLSKISAEFTSGLAQALDKLNLQYEQITPYATPRRIAALVSGIADKTSSKLIEKRGPAKAACFDGEGNLSKAAQGWLRANGLEFEQATFLETEQGSWLYYQFEQPGQDAKEVLFNAVEQAINAIQIPKGMRWGSNDFIFIRPVHTFTMMLNEQVIPGEVFGVKSDNLIYGHRFLGERSFRLDNAVNYPTKLLELGKVIADASQRREIIKTKATELATEYQGFLDISEDLLDEIASLVE